MRVSLGGEARVRMDCFADRAWAAGTVPLLVRAGRAQHCAGPLFAPVFALDHAGDDRRAVGISRAAWLGPLLPCVDQSPGSPSEPISRSPADAASPRHCTTRWRR